MALAAAVAAAGALLVLAAHAQQLPPTWPRCRRKDPNLDLCLRHATQITLPQLAEGAPELGLEPAEPVVLSEGFALRRRPGRISLDVSLSNVSSFGLTGARIHSVFSDIDRGVLDFYFNVPIVVLYGDMEVEGTVQHEPVSRQSGGFNLTLYDAEGFLVFAGDVVERDGERYLDVTQTELDVLSLGGLGVYFDQLDASPQRSAKLNALLNGNAQALWPGLRDGLSRAHADAFQRMARTVFERVPLKDIFLADDHPAVQRGPGAVLLPAGR